MRKIIIAILLLTSLYSEAQIINASAPYRPTWAISCSYILDQYPNAAAAYSLRKLDCDYTGYAIKVRRSSDNTEQDIGFTSNGDLDTSTLKTFCGSNSGYVVTWYDQSGNATNVSQSTSGYQPRIVNAGVVERERKGAKPAVRFLSASFTYLDGGDILDLTELYLNWYAALDLPSANGSPFGKSKADNQNGRWSFLKESGTLYSILQTSSGDANSSVSYSNTDYSLFETYINKSSDSNQLNKNGSQIAVSTAAQDNSATNTTNSFFIGVYQDGSGTAPLSGYYHNGHIGELIVYRKYWNVTQRAAITSSINSYYSIY